MRKILGFIVFGLMAVTLTGCLPLITMSVLSNLEVETVTTKKKPSIKKETGPIRRPLETTETANANFWRKKQMVTVYDCNGHVTSHSVKTVDSKLSKTFTINYPDRKNSWSVSILNRRNGSQPVFPSRGEGQFTVDLSPTLNHLRVSDGDNEIEYVFYKCRESQEINGVKSCKVPLVVEKEGIFLLTVNYEVINLPGEQEVRPAPGQCPQI